jgi:hypothetical protein
MAAHSRAGEKPGVAYLVTGDTRVFSVVPDLERTEYEVLRDRAFDDERETFR